MATSPRATQPRSMSSNKCSPISCTMTRDVNMSSTASHHTRQQHPMPTLGGIAIPQANILDSVTVVVLVLVVLVKDAAARPMTGGK